LLLLRSGLDIGDLDVGQILTVALLAAVIFATFFLEDRDFRTRDPDG
jgi:hypothetical protein